MATWIINDSIEFIDRQSEARPNWMPIFKEQLITLKRSGSIICPEGIQYYKLDFQLIATPIVHENIKALAEQQAAISLRSSDQNWNCKIIDYHAEFWQNGNHYLGNISLATTSL